MIEYSYPESYNGSMTWQEFTKLEPGDLVSLVTESDNPDVNLPRHNLTEGIKYTVLYKY